MTHTNRVLKRTLKMLRKKIPSTSELVKKTDDNTKITQTENKIPSVTGLDTITGDQLLLLPLNAKATGIENKIT